jgi:hypothetical protein
LKRYLKKFKEKGEAAVSKELEQLHTKHTFVPLNASYLSEKQKKRALESLMFLKEKQKRSIKGRSCADGRKQRKRSTKAEATSPTVSLDSVLITAMIDAFDNRDVTIVDAPGA